MIEAEQVAHLMGHHGQGMDQRPPIARPVASACIQLVPGEAAPRIGPPRSTMCTVVLLPAWRLPASTPLARHTLRASAKSDATLVGASVAAPPAGAGPPETSRLAGRISRLPPAKSCSVVCVPSQWLENHSPPFLFQTAMPMVSGGEPVRGLLSVIVTCRVALPSTDTGASGLVMSWRLALPVKVAVAGVVVVAGWIASELITFPLT